MINDNKLENIEKLIKEKKIEEAQSEISKLGSEYYKKVDYLYLRSKIFYCNKLYYLAIDTLLISLEFGESDNVYNLISEIYEVLGNKSLSKKFLDLNLRAKAANSLKNELSGIYRKES